MNGDMAQRQREMTVDNFKGGKLDILVATDVAARGLDVDRISHVVNYDIPYDAEAYIHRIGRTGRAGRTGEAILFVAPRERRMLGVIERATRKKIEQLKLPTTEAVNEKRIADFKQKITDRLAQPDELVFMRALVDQYQKDTDVDALDIAAALAQMSLANVPLLLPKESRRPRASESGPVDRRNQIQRPRRNRSELSSDYEQFRIEVGHEHGVQPGNIVGAIANEAGLNAEHIGRVQIEESHSIVDLPKGMPREVFRDLRKVWVCGQTLKISRLDSTKPHPTKGKVTKRSGVSKTHAKGKSSKSNAKSRAGRMDDSKPPAQMAKTDKKKKSKKHKKKKKRATQSKDSPA